VEKEEVWRQIELMADFFNICEETIHSLNDGYIDVEELLEITDKILENKKYFDQLFIKKVEMMKEIASKIDELKRKNKELDYQLEIYDAKGDHEKYCSIRKEILNNKKYIGLYKALLIGVYHMGLRNSIIKKLFKLVDKYEEEFIGGSNEK